MSTYGFARRRRRHVDHALNRAEHAVLEVDHAFDVAFEVAAVTDAMELDAVRNRIVAREMVAQSGHQRSRAPEAGARG